MTPARLVPPVLAVHPALWLLTWQDDARLPRHLGLAARRSYSLVCPGDPARALFMYASRTAGDKPVDTVLYGLSAQAVPDVLALWQETDGTLDGPTRRAPRPRNLVPALARAFRDARQSRAASILAGVKGD